MQAQTTTERPAPCRRRKLVPQGVPFDELSPGQQKAVRSLRKLREQMAAEIERMIAFLDETDGYSNVELEDDDAEPGDAAMRTALRRYGPPAAGSHEDDEPSLGFPEASEYWHHNKWLGTQHREECLDQTRHAGTLDDREADDGEMEDDDSDAEPDGDDEPSLGSVEGPTDSRMGPRCMGHQEHWAQGDDGDREVEDEHDEDTCDREDDPADGPEEVNEDGDGDPDNEPSLGWAENICQTVPNTSLERCDFELDGSYATDVARQRYKPFDRFTDNVNRDGKHVDTERGYGYATRRLTNLSDRQRAIIKHRIDRDEVALR